MTHHDFSTRLHDGRARRRLARPRAVPRPRPRRRNLKIGCTSLIWGALPRSPDNLGPAVKDMSSPRLPWLRDLRGDSRRVGQEAGRSAICSPRSRIPLISVYATMQVVDPAVRKDELAKLTRWAAVLAEARRPLRRAGAERRQARGLQLPGAPREHRVCAERVRDGRQRSRPRRGAAPAHGHGRREPRRDVRRSWRRRTRST